MCFVLENKQQKQMRKENENGNEKIDRKIRSCIVKRSWSRERSIEWVSPSLTAFRNAAKRRRRNKRRKREISKQANRKILSMRTKLKHRTGIRRKKKERRRSLAPFLACCWIRKCSQFFYVTFSFWLAIMMMMMIMIWYK